MMLSCQSSKEPQSGCPCFLLLILRKPSFKLKHPRARLLILCEAKCLLYFGQAWHNEGLIPTTPTPCRRTSSSDCPCGRRRLETMAQVLPKVLEDPISRAASACAPTSRHVPPCGTAFREETGFWGWRSIRLGVSLIWNETSRRSRPAVPGRGG
jgi:hypothetical protein